MAIPKQIDAQRDFSAGELDPSAKRRDDDEFVKKGARQLSNARVLNAGAISQRPGRNALQAFTVQPREEEVQMAPGVKYRLAFTAAHLTIYDTNGAQVFTEAGRAWSGATLNQIVFAVLLNQVYITFPGVVPEVLTWNGVSTWTSAPYTEQLSTGNQKRTAFYRISPKGVTMNVSAVTGAVTVTLSDNLFVPGMVGTRVRYINRQILLTGFVSSSQMTGVVQEPLPGSQFIGFTIDSSTIFNLGDIVVGTVSGAQGYVIGFLGGGLSVGVQLMSAAVTGIQSPASTASAGGDIARDSITQVASYGFLNTDTIVGPGGAIPANGVSAIGGPNAVPFWDEEVMNAFRGWPASVAVDQGRLIFCNIPSVPGGIIWSAINAPRDIFPDAFPQSAIFELAPGKARVQHVVPGPESAEFVFCDNAVHYIAISASNPLKPGSVGFQRVGSDGAGTVQPRAVGDIILFTDQGLNQVYSIIATGSYTRPFETRPLTDLHAHLFNNIQCIALPTSVTQFPERYAYVVNGDGTVAIGKYTVDESGKLAGKIGWLPWSGSGAVKWASAVNDVVLFNTAYTVGPLTNYLLEQVDATLYLDGSLPVNAIPAALTPPSGKGPLWWLPTSVVDLMDGGLDLGPHATDANGFLIPNFPGENLTSVTLRAGFMWIGVWEPFIPDAQPGQDAGQRMKKRRVSRFEVSVMQSSGFVFRKLKNGEIGPNLPVLGATVSERRIAAYNMSDDGAQPPPLREQAYAFKPLGREHDPRIAIVKDTPGPLIVAEIATRVSV